MRKGMLLEDEWLITRQETNNGNLRESHYLIGHMHGNREKWVFARLKKDETPKYRCESCDKYVPEYIIGFLKLIAWER